eukprot:scaffold64865_cov66-Phaeocystis_antarctica.AAC.1
MAPAPIMMARPSVSCARSFSTIAAFSADLDSGPPPSSATSGGMALALMTAARPSVFCARLCSPMASLMTTVGYSPFASHSSATSSWMAPASVMAALFASLYDRLHSA